MNASQLIEEVEFNTTTSSGPGGQHANKTCLLYTSDAADE